MENSELKNDGLEEVVSDKKKKKKNSTASFLIEIGIYIILILLCIFVVPKYVLQRTVVKGDSMEATLEEGESLLVEKVTKHFTDPKRYDIIVFDPPVEEDKGEFYVKRVIGLPGETVQIIGNEIYINGKVIEDGYGKTVMEADDPDNCAKEPITLGKDEFFVMGDNREVSFDSRSFGPIKRDTIVGSAILRIWPLNTFGTIKNGNNQ